MQATNFTLANYLNRIGYLGYPTTDIDGITRMMQLQLRAVPFENLDVQAGKVVSLVPEHIVDKIVHQQRGGYCYEINGLFSMAIVMELDGRQWLIDLGFGSYGITAPMALDTLNVSVQQGYDRFQLGRTDNGDYLLQAWVDGVWANQYSFDLIAQEWIDFEPVNYLNSTHPEAVFVKSLLVINHNASGRSILFGNALKTIVKGQAHKRSIEPHEIDGILKDVFGLMRPVFHPN
jgi:N-hydroxyarylamine O-acetyltransferase